MASGDKLPLVKHALRELAGQLRAQDHVAIVVYAGASGRVLPPPSGANREAIVEALGSEGSTWG